MTGLTAAVQEQHRRVRRVAVGVGLDAQRSVAGEVVGANPDGGGSNGSGPPGGTGAEVEKGPPPQKDQPASEDALIGSMMNVARLMGAADLAGESALEDAGHVGGGDAAAVVAHFKACKKILLFPHFVGHGAQALAGGFAQASALGRAI